MTVIVDLRELFDTPDARALVGEVFADAADYTSLVEGREPYPGQVDEFFTDVPPGYTKDALALYAMDVRLGDRVIPGAGIAGLLRGWNQPHKTIIGLLLLRPSARRHGVGAAAVAALVRTIGSWSGMRTVRAAVVASNQGALQFWRRNGFVETGEVRPVMAPYTAEIIVFEKPITSTEGVRS